MLSRVLLIIARRFLKSWSKRTPSESKLEAKTQGLVKELLQILTIERQSEITRAIHEDTQGKVASGLFKGMKIDLKSSWGGGLLGPKLLGCYEQEIDDALLRIKDRAFDSVINIGAAEGYFAVGAAMILNTPQVIAIDIDEAALAACQRNAEANGVANKITCQGPMDGDALAAALTDKPNSLVISDCEGFELELFNPAAVNAMGNATCLIECHDFIGEAIVDELTTRLSPTHQVEVISEGPRNPNAYEILRKRHALDRWIIMCEFRPETMYWIFAQPKNTAPDDHVRRNGQTA